MSDATTWRFVPLGGLGEFGMNCMVVEYGDQAIAVDCGAKFPADHMMGVDRVIPDFSYIESLGDRFKGWVLTHGHEDHLGALPYILADVPRPVFATPFTAALLERKLEEHPRAAAALDLHRYQAGDTFSVGCFDIEGIHVTHSIVDACSLAISAGGETVIHTGDFKLDPTPIDGRPSDLDRFRALGEKGIRVLMSDSTNVESKGNSGSESLVRGYIEPAFQKTSGRILVTTFASHVHRLAAVVSLCEQYGRHLVVLGRSMENISSIASHTGHLRIPGSMLVSARDAKHLKPHELCYLVTGSQGEPGAMLTRIALMEMRDLQLERGDSVVFSSKVIPGNEGSVGAVIDQLYRCGVEVYYSRLQPTHVSGHAYRDELQEMIEAVKPEIFVPLHGEYRNLVHHERLAIEIGIPAERCFVMQNGNALEVSSDGATRAASVPAGCILVDGSMVGEVDEAVLRDRRSLARDGVVLLVLGVSRQTGEILSGPDVIVRGLVMDGDDSALVAGARDAVVAAVKEMPVAAIADVEEVRENIRLAARRYFRRELGLRPVVVPYVAEL